MNLQWPADLGPGQLFLIGVVLLLMATQIVVWVLDRLEKHQFGPVFLGTLVTPLCTGFPNLMIGLFGQERLSGDLVLQLNLGNNIANTSLVAGLIIFLAGPLTLGAPKAKSKKARRQRWDQFVVLFFFWVSPAVVLWLAHDGRITRGDGALLISLYGVYQIISFMRRGKVAKKKRLPVFLCLLIILVLGLSAWLIQQSIGLLGQALDEVGGFFPGSHLGLFLGLLTVVPESFLMLRLAFKQGSLGFNGLIGDCLVSVPLVIGLSALFHPIQTTSLPHWHHAALWPYVHLSVTMFFFTGLCLKKQPASRKLGLCFVVLYILVWWNSR